MGYFGARRVAQTPDHRIPLLGVELTCLLSVVRSQLSLERHSSPLLTFGTHLVPSLQICGQLGPSTWEITLRFGHESCVTLVRTVAIIASRSWDDRN